MEWIHVENKLPPKKKDVLLYFDSGKMAVGFWYEVDKTAGIPLYGVCCGDGTWNTSDSYPTHWRELPEEPEVW